VSFCCPIRVVSFRSALDQPPETPYWLLAPTPEQGLGRTKQNTHISTNSWEKGVRGVLQLACLITLASLLGFCMQRVALASNKGAAVPEEAESEKDVEGGDPIDSLRNKYGIISREPLGDGGSSVFLYFRNI